jgi:imidazolonepropionase-like amidohydrolase
MATLGGATALRMQDQVGSLEPGKQADIVVFDTANFDLRPLRRGRPPAQAADLARRDGAPFPDRGDQPPRPRRDRDRPATPLAHCLTHG